jgi:hypothetical protein
VLEHRLHADVPGLGPPRVVDQPLVTRDAGRNQAAAEPDAQGAARVQPAIAPPSNLARSKLEPSTSRNHLQGRVDAGPIICCALFARRSTTSVCLLFLGSGSEHRQLPPDQIEGCPGVVIVEIEAAGIGRLTLNSSTSGWTACGHSCRSFTGSGGAGGLMIPSGSVSGSQRLRTAFPSAYNR